MKRLSSACLALLLPPLMAAEYFVSPGGNNENSGRSAAEPYRTIRRAADMLKPGDTVTVLPGVYHESVELKFAGGDAVTTIRAAVPGAAVLRGDADAGDFSPGSDSPRVWQTACPQEPQAVNERDTLKCYTPVPSAAELDFAPGCYFYDREAKILYIHTSDSAPPDRHHITLSLIRGHGILVDSADGVRNLVIDGFTVSGFNCNTPGGMPGWHAKWGVHLVKPQNCTVRNVTAFLNGGGISFSPNSVESVIEDCRAYANGTPHLSSGGNIVILTPARRSAIRRCLAFKSYWCGIRFYGVPAEECVFEDNIAFEHIMGDLGLKAPGDTTVARRCFADYLSARRIENSVFSETSSYFHGPTGSNIIRPAEKDFDEEREFADPVNFDYRLQADSRYRDRSPELFAPALRFARPGGDDRAAGDSLRSAWGTAAGAAQAVRDGDTLYLAPGRLSGDLVLKNRRNLKIRGRGALMVELAGRIVLENCHDIELTRLNAEHLEIRGGGKITVGFSGFRRGAAAENAEELRFTHNAFTGPLALRNCPGAVVYDNLLAGLTAENGAITADFNAFDGPVPSGAANSFAAKPLFAADFTLRNPEQFDGRGSDGLPVGPCRRVFSPPPLRLDGPAVRSKSATTANIEFFSNLPVTGELTYRAGTQPESKIEITDSSTFHTISLAGLAPGSRVEFQVRAAGRAGTVFSNCEASATTGGAERQASSAAQSFVTLDRDAAPRTLHVAPHGDDRASGTEAAPWRTVSAAVDRARPGDTVVLHDGAYRETARVRATGDADRPITITSAPGARAWLDGNRRELTAGLEILYKQHIKVDRLYFRDQRSSNEGHSAGIFLRGSHDVTVSRCFYDGRSISYTPPFVTAVECQRLAIDNCFVTRAFRGLIARRCPELLIRNSVFYVNQLLSCQVINRANQKFTLRNNIFVDNILKKLPNPLILLSDAAGMTERDNCFYLRVAPELRPLFSYYTFRGRELPLSKQPELLARRWAKGTSFGREMATYPVWLERSGAPATALFLDPEFQAPLKLVQFKDLEDWEQNHGQQERRMNEQEFQRRKLVYAPWDFPGFFAGNPELKKRDIGLQQELFRQP